MLAEIHNECSVASNSKRSANRVLAVVLGAAFVLLLIVGVVYVVQAHQRHSFIEALRAIGGEVNFKSTRNPSAGDYSDSPEVSVFGVDIVAGPVLLDLSGIDCDQLRDTSLRDCPLDVEWVILNDTDVTGECVNWISSMSGLVGLDLSNSRVPPEPFGQLMKSIDLEELSLVNTDIPAEALEILGDSERDLRRLYISTPPANEKIISMLRRDMPWCEVIVRD